MRVLIQNINSRLFYAGDERWVTSESQALDLTRVDAATERLQSLGSSRIILEYDCHGLSSVYDGAEARGRGLAAFRGPVPDWRGQALSVVSDLDACSRRRRRSNRSRGPRTTGMQ